MTVVVTDEQNSAMSGVTVTLESAHLNKKMKKATSPGGRCLFDDLAPGGDYTVTVRKKGFLRVTRKNIAVSPAKNPAVRIRLQVNQKMISGRWRIAQPRTGTARLNEEQEKQKRKLETLSYLAGHNVSRDRKNVTSYNQKRAYNGLNLYCSGHGPEAVLMDMKGRQLHRWHYQMEKVWEKRYNPMIPEHQFWRRVHLGENGNLFAIFEGWGLIKIDKDSNLLWAYKGKAHHDLFIMPGGDIYVLTRKAVLNPKYHKKNLILEDFISILEPDGQYVRRVSILKALENSPYKDVLKKRKSFGDFLHTNTIEVLDGRLAHKSPAFKKGNVLVSVLCLNLIGVVDMEKETFVWAMTGSWKLQHQPSVLDNGNMLLFDNYWKGRKQSRVLEFDPITGNIVWEYHGTEAAPFYTFDCGSCARLPNGNTLVSESNSGRAFEVATDKTVVWEFFTPHRTGENNELVASLFEVVRIGPDYDTRWLKPPGKK